MEARARSGDEADSGEEAQQRDEEKRRWPVLRLIQGEPAVSLDTIGCLEELLDDARRGDLVGMAFAAQYRNRKYDVDTTGEAHTDPTFARGMLCALYDLLGRRARGED